ncbi:ultraviolet-B receptor UVR8 [Pyrus ussuriensis x Pyrus communis]|uniref:Ultraviolet-B receptor UVR8 n=1 Tax=Pyrus ussuriensis x Pyrus communis TaxID=2448454 RepID=A0A5N5FRF9_9ROSA|nr:ultraviolet-B receptor UVR8 [Pyrus ussuriensis x Pyrus communis]
MTNDAGTNRTLIEDVTLCSIWVEVTHDTITEVVMNSTPLHSTPNHDLHIHESDTEQVLEATPKQGSGSTYYPIRPQGKKASKRKGSASKNDYAKYMEELDCQGELTLAREMAKFEADKAREEAKVAATERLFQANERERDLLRQEREELKEERRAQQDRDIMKEPVSMEGLPSHLVLEILSLGRLSAIDLLRLELTSRTFGGSHCLYPHKFRSLVDFAAYQLCASHSVYAKMEGDAQSELFNRCGGKWKRALRFLQSVEQSSDMVETSARNIATGPNYVLAVTDNGLVYSFGSGSNFCLGHGEQHDEFQPRAIQKFKRRGIHVVRVSAGDEHAVALYSNGFVSLRTGDKISIFYCCAWHAGPT